MTPQPRPLGAPAQDYSGFIFITSFILLFIYALVAADVPSRVVRTQILFEFEACFHRASWNPELKCELAAIQDKCKAVSLRGNGMRSVSLL